MKKRFNRITAVLLTMTVLICSLSFASINAEAVNDNGEKSEYDPSPYEPTSEADARYVPTYVKSEESGVINLFNRESAKMLLEMSEDVYSMESDSNDWTTLFSEKYGYTQINKVINSGVYKLCNELQDVEVTDEDGSTHYETIAKERFFSAVNAGVALKPVTYNGKTKYAVVVAFRGSTLDISDWGNNFTCEVSTDGLHLGFQQSALDFYYHTKTIAFDVGDRCMTLYEIIQDMKKADSEFCMMVTGHSLGAAIADVFVGHYLYEDNIYSGNVCAYTYATPLSSLYERNRDNIFNILNNDDPVTVIGSNFHIGQDINYTPDDEFRSHYISGHTQPYAAHMINGSYNRLVDLIYSDTKKYTNSYSTNACNNFDGKMLIDQKCFGNFLGEKRYDDFYGYIGKNSFDDLWIKDASVKFGGDNEIRGDLSFENAQLKIGGNFAISYNDYNNPNKLIMTHETDYLLVNGLFDIDDIDTIGQLTAGTVELKGGFKQYNKRFQSIESDSGYEHYGYYETGTHRTVFSGTDVQGIELGSIDPNYSYYECQFYNLILVNKKIIFPFDSYNGALRVSVRLAADAVIEPSYYNGYGELIPCTFDSLSLNGYNLTIDKGKIICSNLATNGGNLTCGELTGGQITVDSKIKTNKLSSGFIYFENGQIECSGDCQIDVPNMTHDSDYLFVGGTLWYYACNNFELYESEFSAGTIELKGDGVFRTNLDRDIIATGTHNLVLSGTDKQTIRMEKEQHKNGKIQFNNLTINNTSEQGVYFTGDSFAVTNCFNHNQNNFHLDPDQVIEEKFADSDKDGIIDCYDYTLFSADNSWRGDINNDGITSISDVTLIQQSEVGLVYYDGDSWDYRKADINHDGYLDVTDATMIQKYVAQLTDKL